VTITLRNPSNDPVPNRVFGDAPVRGVSVIWHNGNDYGWGQGTQVYAAAAGRVVAVHWSPRTHTDNRGGGYGNHFKIDHGNGYETLYAHLPNSAMLVRLGQQVSVGERIGTMGDSGNASGVHLHFELRHNGRIIDPNPHFGSSTAGIDRVSLIAEPEPIKKETIPMARYIRNADNGTIALTNIDTGLWWELSDPAYVPLLDARGAWDREKDLNVPVNEYNFFKAVAASVRDSGVSVKSAASEIDAATIAKAVSEDLAARLAS